MNNLDHEKVWEVMNDIQKSFNEIITLDGLIDFVEDALNTNSYQEAIDGVTTMKAFMKVYQSKFDKSFTRAWNNTVIASKQQRHSLDYEEIANYLNEENNYLNGEERVTSLLE